MTQTPSITGAARKRPYWTVKRRDRLAGYLFITPQFAGIVVFVLAPLVLVFWYSLHGGRGLRSGSVGDAHLANAGNTCIGLDLQDHRAPVSRLCDVYAGSGDQQGAYSSKAVGRQGRWGSS